MCKADHARIFHKFEDKGKPLAISDLKKPTQIKRKTPIIIILILLITRFSVGLIQLSAIPLTGVIQSYQGITYLLIIILIWRERRNLEDFNISGLSLLIILLFRTVLRFSYDQTIYSFILDLSFWGISGVLVVRLISRKDVKSFVLHSKEIKWIVFGMLLGLGVGFFQLFFGRADFLGDIQRESLLPLSMVWSFWYQLSNAAINEEPLFRGFLWGYLKRAGWKEIHICLLQASLFWLAHINYYNRLSFWFTIPFWGLVYGVLVWKSRSISTTMVSHAAYNAWNAFRSIIE